MENYILKLNSGTEYKLYKGTTLVSDADLTTLFGVAGEMYLSFDFNSGTPSDLTTLTITDSSDNAVISNSNLADTIAEGKNYKATWSNSATTFDTFEELEGKSLDESQLSFLMEKIKEAYDTVEYPISADKRLAEIAWDIIGANEDGVKLVEVKNTTGSNLNIYLGRNASDRRVSVPYRTSAFILLTHRKETSGMVALTVGIMFRGIDTYKVVDQDGSTNAGAYYGLPVTVYNALTATTTGYALDATQGKVLADRIGTLSSLTTTDKTSTVAAINEVDGKVLTNAGAPTTATVGTVGQLLVDTTNGKLYICTDATDPYVWEEVGAGGGGTVPTKTSDLTNDGSDGTSTYVEADELAAVATSGSYTDLSNKPTIPTITMTTTDPGEGSALAANTFIGVYQ